MSATERLKLERRHHDAQARQRSRTFDRQPALLELDDADYLKHENWIAPAIDELGPVRERTVLDLGCGHGMASVLLARRGARVTALDLSSAYLDEARRRASANDVDVRFVHADAERLPFRAASFDAVWGNAILHHLDIAQAARELRRILKPGGRAVFSEPWGGNPLLRWARRRLQYKGRDHTPDERPLQARDVDVLKSVLPDLTVRGFQLLSMVRRAWDHPRLIRMLERVDDALLGRLPFLKHFCRYVVLTARR